MLHEPQIFLRFFIKPPMLDPQSFVEYKKCSYLREGATSGQIHGRYPHRRSEEVVFTRTNRQCPCVIRFLAPNAGEGIRYCTYASRAWNACGRSGHRKRRGYGYPCEHCERLRRNVDSLRGAYSAHEFLRYQSPKGASGRSFEGRGASRRGQLRLHCREIPDNKYGVGGKSHRPGTVPQAKAVGSSNGRISRPFFILFQMNLRGLKPGVLLANKKGGPVSVRTAWHPRKFHHMCAR